MQRSKHQKKLNLPPIEINIEALSHEGAGIGRLEDGKVVFVEDALPQETISCQLTENRKRFAKGRVPTLE